MKLNTSLSGVTLIAPDVQYDNRGWFMEAYNEQRDYGLFVPGIRQISTSQSSKNVVRGLHLQINPATNEGMTKLIRVLRGSIFLVNVDVLPTSPTFGQHYATVISEDNKRMCYADAHIARGFCALEDNTVVEYLHNTTYDAREAWTIAWDDYDLKIPWPVKFPKLSAKDSLGLSLEQWEVEWKNRQGTALLKTY